MRFLVPGIRRQGWNSRLRFGAASGRSRRPIARLHVEGLESRCLLAVTINEFLIPTAHSSPLSITAGPDGNLWFTESSANKIGEIDTTTHVITEFPVPTANSGLGGITTGPDGNIWFTEESGQIGQINPTTHAITEFRTATVGNGFVGPQDITTGTDGNLWFTDYTNNEIGEINPTTHAIAEFPIPTASCGPSGITTGPGGNLWFTELITGKIGQINPITHAITEFSIPTSGSGPDFITTGTDGNLWFTEGDVSKIGEINPTTHAITEFPVPTASSFPFDITAGPDGNIWFTEGSRVGNQIGEINPTTGAIAEFPIPTATSYPDGITTGPDGNIWFIESGTNKIGQVVVPPPVTAPDLALAGTAPGSGTPGQNVSDTLTVTNNGSAGATGVTLTDTLPSGVTFVSATGGVTPVHGVLTLALGNLAAGASATVTIIATPTAAGTLTENAAVSMDQTDATPSNNSLTLMTTITAAPPVVPSIDADGPKVVSVLRYGYHMMPTSLVLTFDQALDATTAQVPKDYRIIGPAGRTITIKKAVYDSASLTVTLHPEQRISIHHRYTLIVDGTAPHGLTNTRGQLLDGADHGQPDSDYRASLTWRNLVLDPPPNTSDWSRRTTVKPNSRSASADSVSHAAGLFTRSVAFHR